MADKEFPNGLLVKSPRAGAPEYVMGSLSIKRQEFIDWLQGKEGDWVNLELKVAKGSGKPYAEVDNWKPEGKGKPAPRQPASRGGGGSDGQDEPSDEIPFATKFSAW